MVNLFIHILQNPGDLYVKSDVTLMGVALGHFRRIESVAPDLSLPFAREILRLARLVVERFQTEAQTIASPSLIALQSDQYANVSLAPSPSLFDTPMQSLSSHNFAMVSSYPHRPCFFLLKPGHYSFTD
jgi:hypothetical protein